MNAKIVTFSSHGGGTVLENDPTTADMDEVNRVIAEYEAKLVRSLSRFDAPPSLRFIVDQ